MTTPNDSESDYEVTRKHLAVLMGMSYRVALILLSDSKLQAVQTADPDTFLNWLEKARAWRSEENLSYH